MTQRNLRKSYFGLFLLVCFWIAFGIGFKGEASTVSEVSEQPGRIRLESQDPYTQEVVRLENGNHTGLSIQHRRILRRKGAWLLAALILWWLWKNFVSGKYWCDIVLKKAKKEYVDAFERRGPPLSIEVF